ncbi:hypothetical protein AFK68_11085 [Hydrocoleum sp. CS-953]|nr:hypothetical protein AFK68_11085 [Hydrocoleum sp. CS-953]
MWYNNRLVLFTYAHVNTRYAFAGIEGVSGGWKRIAPTSPDGVTNVLDILKVAQGNKRRVHVYIANDGMIYAAIMLP